MNPRVRSAGRRRMRITKMKRFSGFLLAVLCACVLNSAVAIEDPSAIVQATTDKVLERIQSEKKVLQNDPKKMFNLVSELIFPHFDFDIMSQWVLGEHWAEADDKTQTAFVDQFRKLLVRTYATALLEFSDQAITYPPIEQKGGAKTALVKQEISQPGSAAIPIVYRLHNKTGEWKVFDVSVDGVSLVKTYRASFGSMIKDGGIDALIASLSSKNKKNGQ